MPTVVLSAYDVVAFPEGGGHLSAYLQYAHGLRAVGCDVWWLEQIRPGDDAVRDRRLIQALAMRLEQAGLHERLIVYAGDSPQERSYLNVGRAQAERIFRTADLLLNFHYEIDSSLLGCFRRSALVDIDPGLVQFWIDEARLRVPHHDVYFTIGETVGSPAARFPSCGIDWIHIRPPVSLEHWPVVHDAPQRGFTTVSSWWSEEWFRDPSDSAWHENNKRASFLEYAKLPGLVSVPLELALNTSPADGADIALLERNGWRVRHASDVAHTPTAFRDYVQRSMGEFGCAKPSCVPLQNAWISDRTVCYLASGRPAVVQDTGPSKFLEGAVGLLRFSSLDEAASALQRVTERYAEHSAAARELAETYFDARQVASEILRAALDARGRSCS